MVLKFSGKICGYDCAMSSKALNIATHLTFTSSHGFKVKLYWLPENNDYIDQLASTIGVPIAFGGEPLGSSVTCKIPGCCSFLNTSG
jgi:hypothetical protein